MNHRIVVLGAGYAGVHAAGRLARQLRPGDTEITLLDAEPDFVERVRMHQLATGQVLRQRALREIFTGTGVTVHPGRVTAVDVNRRTVVLTDQHRPGELDYDTLVYALGSTTAGGGVPGVAEHAHHVADKHAALRLCGRLRDLTAGATVLVAGGGLTGIETATEIAETRPDLDVTIAARRGVGDWLSDKARNHLRRAFARLGVTVRERTDITCVNQTSVTTATAGHIPSQTTVWTTGFAAHPIAGATTLEVADTGQIVVDDTMRSISHPDVYAVGDAAIANGTGGTPLRMSCASAIPMAWQAADAIAARLTDRALPGNTIRYHAQCISLGRRDGIIQFVTHDDRVTSSVITGRMAAWIKERVCAAAAWSISHPRLMMPRATVCATHR